MGSAGTVSHASSVPHGMKLTSGTPGVDLAAEFVAFIRPMHVCILMGAVSRCFHSEVKTGPLRLAWCKGARPPNDEQPSA